MSYQDKNSIYQESVKEKLTFSPIDKYVKYDRFPTKLLIHILLVILTTISVITISSSSNKNFRNQREIFFSISGLVSNENYKQLYSISQLQDHLKSVTENLKNINEVLFQKVAKPPKYYLEVNPIYPGSFLKDPKFYNSSNKFENDVNSIRTAFQYPIPDISKKLLIPFDIDSFESLKYFSQRVKSFSMVIDKLELKVNNHKDYLYSTTCWRVILNFEMESFSHFLATLNTYDNNCEELNNEIDNTENFFIANTMRRDIKYKPNSQFDTLKFLHFAILILAIISMILNWRYIYEMMNLYMDTRIRSKRKDIKKSETTSENEFFNDPSYLVQLVSGKGEKTLEKLLESQKPWDQLTFREKLLFFDLWFIFCMIGNFIQIWGSILTLANDFNTSNYKSALIEDLLVGFSCWFAWLNLLRYLEYNKDIHLLTNVMRNAGPQIIRFMIGFLPIFFAYVFLGVCLFWRYQKFETVNEAIISLFSIIMGDNVFGTFTDTIGVGLLGEIYLFSFVIIFIICVHNIFVSIICSKAMEKKKEKENDLNLCLSCKKCLEKPINMELLSIKNDNKHKNSDDISEKNVPKRPSDGKPKWDTISKGLQLKKYHQDDEMKKGIIPVKRDFDHLEEIKKRMFDQIALHRKEINYLLDEMRKDAIDDVELYDLKYGQKLALKKKYKQQMEYLKSKIKSMLDPLKL